MTKNNDIWYMDEQAVELKKDKGCVYCEHLFNCIGKPKDVELCLQFKDRRNGK